MNLIHVTLILNLLQQLKKIILNQLTSLQSLLSHKKPMINFITTNTRTIILLNLSQTLDLLVELIAKEKHPSSILTNSNHFLYSKEDSSPNLNIAVRNAKIQMLSQLIFVCNLISPSIRQRTPFNTLNLSRNQSLISRCRKTNQRKIR